jgi:hypothetical protein
VVQDLARAWAQPAEYELNGPRDTPLGSGAAPRAGRARSGSADLGAWVALMGLSPRTCKRRLAASSRDAVL